MRLAWVVVPCLLSAQATKFEPRCSVSGTLLNSITGRPVADAELSLAGVLGNYSVKTGTDGKFVIAQMYPGRYRLSGNRSGFGRTVRGTRALMGAGSTLFLDPNQVLKDITLDIAPHVVLTGRVTGLQDSPIPEVRVQAFRTYHSQHGKGLVAVMEATTNDLGEFRLYGLDPGTYYIGCTVRPRPTAEEQYLPTFYPGAGEIAAAAPVAVAAGVDLGNLDIRLVTGFGATIAGTVYSESGEPAPGGGDAVVMLVPSTPGVPIGSFQNRLSAIDGKGKFGFHGVPRGSYDMVAWFRRADRTDSSRQRIEVGDESIAGLILTVGRNLTLTGRVRLQEEAKDTNLKVVRIQLLRSDPRMASGQTVNAAVSADGNFTISDVSPDGYMIQVNPIPGHYIKSIRSGYTDLMTSPLDLTAGVSQPIDVLLANGGGEVTGTVEDSAGRPLAGAKVVLAPEEVERQRFRGFYRLSTANQSGGFNFIRPRLPPGKYRLLALEEMDGMELLDPEFLKPLESRSERITVQEGSRQTVRLKSIPVQ